MEHSTGDMMRSIVEGVAMNLNLIIEILKNAVEINEMLLVGGLAKGGIQQQICADVYGMDVVRLKHLEEATSIGAAVIAGVGVGELPDFQSVSLFNERMTRTKPMKENVAKYQRLKPVFDKAYFAQLDVYDALLELGL
jgi:xylulokinase